MPILNYTTSVDAKRTVAEIQAMLTRKGAARLMIDYENGIPTAIAFQIAVKDHPLHFRLPCRHKRVQKVLERDRKVERRHKTELHALNVAWRNLKDWLEAQFALIETEMVDMAEVFLPYAITPTGATMYEAIRDAGYLLEAKEK